VQLLPGAHSIHCSNIVRNRKRERYMEANLTRYTCFLRDDGHSIAALMVPSDTGEYVKFADVKESLSKSHNKQSTPYCLQCHSPSKWVIACKKCGSIIEE
jgi:hypothetical protein